MGRRRGFLRPFREIAAVRTEFETHLRTANADMVAALTKSTEVIAHNSALIEQIQRKLMD
jgi:hypothetical protein